MTTDTMSAEEAQRLKTNARLAREFADVKDREAAWIALELAEAQQERDALHAQLAQVTAERDELRSIVEGRTTPPTDEEIVAHGGPWLVVLDHRAGQATRVASGDYAATLAAQQRAQSRAWVWHPVDERDGALVAWPVVDR